MARREARFARCPQQRNAPQYSVAAPTCRNHDAARFVARQQRLARCRARYLCENFATFACAQRLAGPARAAATRLQARCCTAFRSCRTWAYSALHERPHTCSRQRANAGMDAARRAAFETNRWGHPVGHAAARVRGQGLPSRRARARLAGAPRVFGRSPRALTTGGHREAPRPRRNTTAQLPTRARMEPLAAFERTTLRR